MITFEQLYKRFPRKLRRSLENSKQNKTYHKETVYEHIKLVFNIAQSKYNDNDLMVCALFHDLGKPETQKIKIVSKPNWLYKILYFLFGIGEVRISNINHEVKIDKYLDLYFHLFADITTDKEKVFEICSNHMRVHQYVTGQLKKPTKRKDFEALKYFEDIIKFNDCDQNGRL